MHWSTALCCLCLVLALPAMLSQSPLDWLDGINPLAAQLSPSVFILGEADWKLVLGASGKPGSRCLDMVARAKELSTSNKLAFNIFQSWIPNSDGLGIKSLCYMPSGNNTSLGGGKLDCMLWTVQKLVEFKEGLTACFLEALKSGFVPYVTPQLVDGLNKGIWPNALLFSPTATYGTFSYAETMITPLAAAMRDALAAAAQLGQLYTPPAAARPTVFIALQGEMSATLMRYASDYEGLIPLIKETIGSDWADVMVGAGLNYNALDAVEGPAMTLGSSFLDGIMAGIIKPPTNSSAPAIQVDVLKRLFTEKLDFLGISSKSPFSGAGFSTNEFFNSANSVSQALASLVGVDLPALVNAGQLELIYTSFGIGGGEDWMSALSTSVESAAKAPWAGVFGEYSSALDPWRNHLLGAFRESFFGKALTWLAAPTTGSLTVSQVFVSAVSSWDVFGIYSDSTTAAGSFRDMTIVQQIAHYNAAVMASMICMGGRATAPCQAFLKANEACLVDDSGAACLRNKPVTTESGSAQQPSPSPAPATQTPAPDTPAEEESGPAPEEEEGKNESGPAAPPTGLEMGPGDSAASPAPSAATASPPAVITTPTPAAAATKSAASGKQLAWSLLLPPLIISGVVLLG